MICFNDRYIHSKSSIFISRSSSLSKIGRNLAKIYSFFDFLGNMFPTFAVFSLLFCFLWHFTLEDS